MLRAGDLFTSHAPHLYVEPVMWKAMKEKREILADALVGKIAHIVVDTRQEQVELPEYLMTGNPVVLNLSWKYAGPMSLDQDAIRARLHFSGIPFNCVIPWDAVVEIGHSTGPQGRFVQEEKPSDPRSRFQVIKGGKA